MPFRPPVISSRGNTGKLNLFIKRSWLVLMRRSLAQWRVKSIWLLPSEEFVYTIVWPTKHTCPIVNYILHVYIGDGRPVWIHTEEGSSRQVCFQSKYACSIRKNSRLMYLCVCVCIRVCIRVWCVRMYCRMVWEVWSAVDRLPSSGNL